MNRLELGAQFRKARIENSYSQADVASRLEVTQQFVSAIERGVCECPDWVLEKLLDLYGLNEWDIQRKRGLLPRWLIERLVSVTESPNVRRALVMVASGAAVNLR